MCEGTKRDGTPCRVAAREGSAWCWAHDPEQAEKRRENAVKGGRARGPGPELREVQNRIRQLAEGVINGTVDKGRASVAFQGLGVYVRSVEVARKLRETEELERRIEELEAERDQDRYGTGGGVDW
jgi:hypothetical protein